MRTAIYPGTFDPITLGHIDVIKKSLKIADRVIVASTDNINKDYYFSIDERISIINNSLFKDLKLNRKKIIVVPLSRNCNISSLIIAALIGSKPLKGSSNINSFGL